MERCNFEVGDPLVKVRKFCVNFDGGNIIQFADGSCNVERLDNRGQVIGIYKFNQVGTLIDYELSKDPTSTLKTAIAKLDNKKEKYQIFTLPKKATPARSEKNA